MTGRKDYYLLLPIVKDFCFTYFDYKTLLFWFKFTDCSLVKTQLHLRMKLFHSIHILEDFNPRMGSFSVFADNCLPRVVEAVWLRAFVYQRNFMTQLYQKRNEIHIIVTCEKLSILKAIYIVRWMSKMMIYLTY